MKKEELLELGFKETSYTDEEGNTFTEFMLETDDNFKILVSGDDYLELYTDGIWITRPYWNTIEAVKKLINIFSIAKEEIDYGTFFKPYCNSTLTKEQLENLTNPSKNGK